MPHSQTALISLLQVVIGIYLFMVIVRFFLEYLSLSRRNPVLAAIMHFTHRPVRLLRQYVPRMGGVDCGSLVLIWLLGLCHAILDLITLRYVLEHNFLLELLFHSIFVSLNAILWVFIVAIFGSVVLSWIGFRGLSANSFADAVHAISDFVLTPFRRILPPIGGLSFAPLLAFFALRTAQYVLEILLHGFN